MKDMGLRAMVRWWMGGRVRCQNSLTVGLLLGSAAMLSACTPGIDAYEFRCTEVGSLDSLYTKLGGQSFNMDLVSLLNGVVQPLDSKFANKNGTLDFVDATQYSVAQCESGVANVGTGTKSITITSAAAASGRQTISSVNINNAYPALMCRATGTYTTLSLLGIPLFTETYRKCGWYSFATRPASFSVTTTNASADTSGSNAATTDSTQWFKASVNAPVSGTAFNLTVNALSPSAAVMTQYRGTPTVDNSLVVGHAGAGGGCHAYRLPRCREWRNEQKFCLF